MENEEVFHTLDVKEDLFLCGRIFDNTKRFKK